MYVQNKKVNVLKAKYLKTEVKLSGSLKRFGNFNYYNCKGFTLAEVLITLGIIGIVAAMTLPAILEHHEKVVTANKLKKFYTVMQQAILFSENENEELKNWMPSEAQVRKSEGFEQWYNLYLDKHIQSINKKKLKEPYYQITLADGSGFVAYIANRQTIFFMYCTDIKYCGPEIYDGRHSFLFTIDSNKKFIASLVGSQNATREKLLDSCSKGNFDDPENSRKDARHDCTRLIQYDGWEIKKDYPWRQTMIKKQKS